MSLLSTLMSSIDRAKGKTVELFSNLVITVVGSTQYDPATGLVSSNPRDSEVSVMTDKWEYGEVNGESVRSDDLKLFTFDSLTNLQEGDQVDFQGGLYSLVSISPIVVGNNIVARYLQLRK